MKDIEDEIAFVNTYCLSMNTESKSINQPHHIGSSRWDEVAYPCSNSNCIVLQKLNVCMHGGNLLLHYKDSTKWIHV